MNFKEIQRLYIFLSQSKKIHKVNRIHQPSGPNCCQFEAKKSSFPRFFFFAFFVLFFKSELPGNSAIFRDLFGMVMVIRDPLNNGEI